MNLFPVSRLLSTAHVVGHFYPAFASADHGGDWDRKRLISDAERTEWTSIYGALAVVCDAHDLAASLATVKKMLRCLEDPTGTYGQFFGFGEELYERLKDETETKEFIGLTASEANAYRDDAPFGDSVKAAFPTAEYDIEEASKCLALNRSTAAAFHALRCLEAGIKAMSRCLSIPDPTRASGRNWGEMLRALKAEMDSRWPNNSVRMSGDGAFFDNAYATLAAIQNPWRNATMHLDQKYTLEEAANIFSAVKSLMKTLAARMDDSGLPLA